MLDRHAKSSPGELRVYMDVGMLELICMVEFHKMMDNNQLKNFACHSDRKCNLNQQHPEIS